MSLASSSLSSSSSHQPLPHHRPISASTRAGAGTGLGVGCGRGTVVNNTSFSLEARAAQKQRFKSDALALQVALAEALDAVHHSSMREVRELRYGASWWWTERESQSRDQTYIANYCNTHLISSENQSPFALRIGSILHFLCVTCATRGNTVFSPPTYHHHNVYVRLCSSATLTYTHPALAASLSLSAGTNCSAPRCARSRGACPRSAACLRRC
jgi:hypothetical protein